MGHVSTAMHGPKSFPELTAASDAQMWCHLACSPHCSSIKQCHQTCCNMVHAAHIGAMSNMVRLVFVQAMSSNVVQGG
eukprot:1159311-Pelagomonas_calceolata.AAC.8